VQKSGANVCKGSIPLKNSVVRLPVAIFEARRPVCYLFIILLGDNMNQSFDIYLSPDFFYSIGPYSAIAITTDQRRSRWKQDLWLGACSLLRSIAGVGPVAPAVSLGG